MGDANNRPNRTITVPELLKKLDDLYNQEEQLDKEIKRLLIIKEQLNDDIQMLEMSIMYKSNRTYRGR